MDLEYKQIGESLTPLQMAKVMRTIDRSKKVEIAYESFTGRINHLVLKGTNKIFGYLGADNQIEEVNSSDESLKEGHNFLRGIYRIITNVDRIS